jgi:putative ABC transport system permease protein
MTFVVVDRRASFPGMRADVAFVVAPLALIQAAYEHPPLPPSALFVRGSSGIQAQLTALLGDRSPSSVITSRFGRYEALRQAPFVAMVTGGFRIALAIAVLYAALAIVAALTLTASRRSQDLAFLRTVGLSARQALGLTIVEHGPPVVLALLPGVALGIWTAVLLAPGLGLAAFVGPDARFAISIAWGEIALIGAALVIMVTIAGATSTWLARRTRAVDALRLGGD